MTLAVFAPCCGFEFSRWDDPANVYLNPDLNPVTPAAVVRCWTAPYRNMYIPATYTAWAGLAAVARTRGEDGVSWTLNPYVFHAANVALHLATTLAVFAVLRRLLGQRGDWPACAGALLFAIHPLQVEPVAWVSGLRDLLSGLFAALTIWLYVLQATARNRLAYAGCLLTFALAILSKPAVTPLPLALAAIDFFLLRRDRARILKSLAGLLVLSLAAAVLTKLSQPAAEVDPAPIWARPIVMLDAYAFYIVKLIAPVNLGLDYGRTPQWLLSSSVACITAALVCGVACAAILAARSRALFTGAIIFVAMLLPVSGLVTFDFQRHSTVADRYIYLSMIGVALAAAYAIRSRPTRNIAILTAVLLAACAARAAAQVQTWRDGRTTFEHALAVNPGSLAGAAGLAEMEMESHDYARAIAHLRAALPAHPDDAIINYDLGNALLMSGDVAQAVPHYRVALKRRHDPFIYTNLATALAKSGNLQGAIAACEEGLSRWPDNPQLHYLQGALAKLPRPQTRPATTAPFK